MGEQQRTIGRKKRVASDVGDERKNLVQDDRLPMNCAFREIGCPKPARRMSGRSAQ